MKNGWKTPQLRRQKLAAIHVAKAQLDMADESYRDLLARVSATRGTSCRSAADLTFIQAMAVLDEMSRLGATMKKVPTKRGPTRPASYPGKPENFDQLPAQIAKIEAQLTDMKLSWAYADAIAKRMFKTERVAWLQTSKDRYGVTTTREMKVVAILAALEVEQEKRDLLAAVTKACADRDLELDSLPEKFKLPKGWKRRRSTLSAILDHFFPERALMR